MHWRIAHVACGVARARVVAGNLPLARQALDDAVRLSPRIEETRLVHNIGIAAEEFARAIRL